MPSVRPFSPAALLYSFLFHLCAPRVGDVVRDSPVHVEHVPHDQLATAIAFMPGQLATLIPFFVAYGTSIVSTPEPARITSFSDLPASNCGLHLVERTIRMADRTPRCAGERLVLQSGSHTTPSVIFNC